MSATDGPSASETDTGPAWLPLGLVFVSLLPNLRAAIPGLTYYLRDFSLTFYPLREFFIDEVRHGRWPFWNPYLYEGSALLPSLYPGDLIQALFPGPAAASFFLTLHLPLAALGAWLLARDLDSGRWGAFLTGALFATGGFTLSTLNLYCFLQALALAPFVVLWLRRAALRGGRAVPIAALLLALSVSTLAIEFVTQAVALGLLLGWVASGRLAGAARGLWAAALGGGLASLPILLMAGIVPETLRGPGLAASEMLLRPLNPFTLGQLVLPRFLGEPGDSLRVWWAGRLFPDGSPYFLSLYLGPLGLALACVGGDGSKRRERRALLVAAGLAAWFALGRGAGLAGLLLPLVPFLRFPVKALLLPHLALCLFAGFGLTRLERGGGFRRFAGVAASLAVAVAAVPVVLAWPSQAVELWLDISPRSATALHQLLPHDAAVALVQLAAGLALAVAVGKGQARAGLAAALLGVLAVADVARAGVGFNRQAAPALLEPLPGLAAELATPDGARVFSYGVNASPAVAGLLRTAPPDVELAAFRLSREALNPFLNVLDRVEIAEGVDRHSFMPNPPALEAWEYAPSRVGAALNRLRNAAVSRVVSLDPLEHPDLRLRAALATGVPGFTVHVYDLARPWPRAYVACRVIVAGSRSAAAAAPFASGFDPQRDVALEAGAEGRCGLGAARRTTASSDAESFEVDLDAPGVLVSRASFTPSWRALVDGVPAPVLRANGRHRAVALPAGHHTVVLRYAPPGLRAGLIGTLLSGLVTALLLRRPLSGPA